MSVKKHPSYLYAKQVVNGKIPAPKYVRKQATVFKLLCDGKDKRYKVNEKTVLKITAILKLLKMPKGLSVGLPLFSCLSGFQWMLIIASLAIVHRKKQDKRRYETVVLEIARKNGKTFLVAVIVLLLFFLEPSFSYFYSVAPDGSLSREIKKALEELISFNAELLPQEGADRLFKLRRDDIECLATSNKYIPLNYSNSRLDGKLPNAYIADEVGALPNSYALEAMRSGQLTILNKIGFVISTKYPTAHNPFEDEISYCKKVLNGKVEDDKIFCLLYEPDNQTDWMTDDSILQHANPLALDVQEVWDDLLDKRQRAIEMESARENFLTKHCNIIYQGAGTESYIDINQLQACRVDKIEWSGREAYLGVDLAQTTDNCAVAMVSADDDNDILAEVIAFIPEGRINEKSNAEHIDYLRFVQQLQCIACGDMVVDYGVIEDYVFSIEQKFGVTVVAIGYDRYNAMSSAQKWGKKYTTVEVRQHSDTLHPPTKLLAEKIANKEFQYTSNTLLEINFENAKCTYDTNMNRYVNKKKSNGKIDMVVALINAVYLMQQDIIFSDQDFVAMVC